MARHLALGVFALLLMTFGCSDNSGSQSAANSDQMAEQQPATPQAKAPAKPVTLSSLAAMPAGKYNADVTHTYINFGYLHQGYSYPHVGFESFSVDLTLDPSMAKNNQLMVEIDANSVDSRVAEFDDHLRGEKFFDTTAHPMIAFKANSFTPTSDNTLEIGGDLTIKGVTHPVLLNTVVNKAGNHPMSGTPTIGISATANIKRSDWGLDTAVPFVSDAVTLQIESELVQSQP